MTTKDYPRLCGGTFFTLVLQALRQRIKAREHYKGESDGLTDPDVLMGLITVVNPDFIEPVKGALKGKTNDYKACKTSSGQYLPFGNTAEVRAFDERVKTNYEAALKEMALFVDRFIDMGTAVGKANKLVLALIDLIEQDQSISDDEVFYVEESGQAIKKTALGGLNRVCLPAFLLGVWHYAVVNRKDNSVGQTTYDSWCPPNGGRPRIYMSHMGEGKPEIAVYTVEVNDSKTDPEPEIFDEAADASTFSAEPQSSGVTQIYNNPLIIHQQGDGNTVIPNYGNITINKK